MIGKGFWQKRYLSKHTGAEIDAAVDKAAKLPAVTGADEGKVLTVDDEGNIVTGEGGGGGISISTQYTITWNTDRATYELLSVDSYASSDEADAARANTQSEAIIATLSGGLFDETVVTLMPAINGSHYAVFYMGGLKIVTVGLAIEDIDGRYYLSGDALITSIS